MDVFDYCIIIFLLVFLVLLVGIYAYLLWFHLKEARQKNIDLRKNADALDLQVEALKLLIKKYQSSFPPTICEDIEIECQNASERSWNAPNRQAGKDAVYEEKCWNILREWVNRNFEHS